MDTFVDSSWYFARFCSPHACVPVDTNAVGYRCPRSINISAAWSMRSCICSTRASSLAPCTRQGTRRLISRSRACSTQGMVTHETYKDAHGKWVTPRR